MRNNHLQRAARDRLIDLIGIGKTYPLTDLEVARLAVKVAVNHQADIPIELSQSYVRYQLHTTDNKVVLDTNNSPFTVDGNTAQALLKTPEISVQSSFKIYANKLLANGAIDQKYGAYLQHLPKVSVGLDTQLSARIIDADLLEGDQNINTDMSPRIIDYNQNITVQIDNSQEGVSYQLFTDKEDTQSAISNIEIGLGAAQPIRLLSHNIFEDIDVLIRISKVFAPTMEIEVSWLALRLPLKVRADTHISLTVDGANIVNFDSSSRLLLSHTQESVTYKVYRHIIEDNEFLYENNGSDNLSVSVTGFSDVQVVKPTAINPWNINPLFYTQVIAGQGTGADLNLAIGNMRQDSTFIVIAEKQHRVDRIQTIHSKAVLTHASMLLVKPDPKVLLDFNITKPNATHPVLQVANGQDGVFYDFKTRSNSAEISLPAYFHRIANSQRQETKGIDQLRIEVDFVIAKKPPINPVSLSLGSMPSGTLTINARRAMTNASTQLAKKVPIPVLTVFQNTLNLSVLELVITNSTVAVVYQLLVSEQMIGAPLTGDGSNLTLNMNIIDFQADYVLRSTHHLATGTIFVIDQQIDIQAGQV
jgi:hypothetical protein